MRRPIHACSAQKRHLQYRHDEHYCWVPQAKLTRQSLHRYPAFQRHCVCSEVYKSSQRPQIRIRSTSFLNNLLTPVMRVNRYFFSISKLWTIEKIKKIPTDHEQSNRQGFAYARVWFNLSEQTIAMNPNDYYHLRSHAMTLKWGIPMERRSGKFWLWAPPIMARHGDIGGAAIGRCTRG